MIGFFAFLKKELLESHRSGKMLFVLILFFAFGVMNPAIAKLTPYLLEMLADELRESGMTVGEVTVNALTSWTQFFKNIPMALIAFVLLYGGSFVKEYESETLLIVLTRGLKRKNVVLAKTALMLSLWSIGYLICFATTYLYNEYLFDNSIAENLGSAVFGFWLFGVFTLALTVFFSCVFSSYGEVLLGTGASVALSYAVGLLPKLSRAVPTSLMNSAGLLVGAESGSDYVPALVVTVIITFALLAGSVLFFNRKKL